MENKADHILNWHLDSALLWLNENRVNYRLSRKDGKYYIGTSDLKRDRANLHIENGFVIKITYG